MRHPSESYMMILMKGPELCPNITRLTYIVKNIKLDKYSCDR